MGLSWLALPGCFTTGDVEPAPPTVASVQPTMPTPEPGMPDCTRDQDCGTPTAACIAGECVDQDCTSVLDCPGLTVCDTLIDRCVECVGNQECIASGLVCVANRCVEPCTGDAACLPLVCNQSVGLCVACDVRNACPAGLSCTDQGCVVAPDVADLDAGMSVGDAGGE